MKVLILLRRSEWYSFLYCHCFCHIVYYPPSLMQIELGIHYIKYWYNNYGD